jgi:superfamily II DNA or RNA helicase
MKPKLYDWQQPSADRIVSIFNAGGQVAIDASDTGAGKTYVALEVISQLKVPVLIICPKSVKTAWARAAEDFGVKPIAILTSQKLLYRNPHYVDDAWALPDNTLIIWDEAHQGSGEATKTVVIFARTKVFKVPVLALSATIADTPLKMRGLGFLLNLHSFNKPSFKRWCLDHGCYPSPFALGKLEFSKGPKGRKALADIHAEIKDRMVRIQRSDIPDFPQGLVISKLIDLDASYAKEVKQIYKDMEARLKLPGANELVELGKAREKTERYKVPAFVELVTETLAEGVSPVVFLNYHSSREALVDALTEAGITNVSQIHGRQNDEDRAEAIDRFQDNTNHVCVVMAAAGGAGISLHDLNGRPRATFVTPSFNAVEMLQVLGRAHRLGGSKVIQTFVLAANTIEERIHRAIQRKLKNIQTLNDGDLV